jgi:hypothetical protein
MLPAAANAQVTREHELPELAREPGSQEFVKLRFTLANRFVGNADFGTFDATSNQPEARLRIDIPISRNALLRVIGTGRALIYDWHGESSLPGGLAGGDPFDNLYAWDTRVQAIYLLDNGFHFFSENERWALIAEGGVKVSFEAGSNMSNGLRPRGTLAVGFRWSDRFEAALGVTIGKKLIKNKVSAGPLFEFDWKINDDWSLKSYGLGAQLQREFGESWTVYTRMRLEGGSYRLGDRGDDIGSGAVKLRQMPVGVGVRWKRGWFSGRVTVGAMLLQKLKIKDGNNDTIGSETAPPSAFVTVRIDLRP